MLDCEAMGRPLVLAASLILAFANTLGAGSQRVTPLPSYLDAADLYRAGNFDAAVLAVQDLTPDAIQEGVDVLLERAPPVQTLKAAAMVLTESAIRSRAARSEGWPREVVASNRVIDRIDRLQPHSEFLRDWRLLMTAAFQGQHELPLAMDYARGTWSWIRVSSTEGRAQAVAGTKVFTMLPDGVLGDDDPGLRLAVGTIHEMAWVRRHENGEALTTGNLDVAIRELQRSLALRPDAEARIHLGRVLTLSGNYNLAEGAFAAVGTAVEPAFKYLLELFKGDLAERRGDTGAAAEHYAAAIPLLPAAQSAHIALAQVRHAGGNRSAAAAGMLDALTTQRGAPDSADPWVWYVRGMAWHVDEYRERLRESVHREVAR